MNVTALLDTPVRSPAPLDPSVGDDATDPAFANVMSQYQGNGNKSLTNEPPKGEADANCNSGVDAAATTNVAANSADNSFENAGDSAAATDDAPVSLPDLIGQDGMALPPDGQAVADCRWFGAVRRHV